MAERWSPPSSPPATGKRKRRTDSLGTSESSVPAHLSSSSINPLSYPPSTLLQLTVAGLSETSELPSSKIPHFPHRGLDSKVPDDSDVGTGAESDGGALSEAGGGEDEAGKGQGKAKSQKDKWPPTDREGHTELLVRSIHQFLDQGAISRAARAYGLVLQMRPHGRPVDVRHHNLWAIGAEILMREGERPIVRTTEDEDENERRGKGKPRRWGSAANLNKVKAYFDTLIQLYPYDYRRPRSVSAVDFWLAMLGCEVYNAHAEHAMAIAHLDEDEPRWGDEEEALGNEDDEPSNVDRRRDELRVQALTAMKDITRRMDGLMRDPPYSKTKQFLRLRAMASLYVADLLVPIAEKSTINIERAKGTREMEQQKARDILQKMVDNGGDLDHVTRAILDPDGEQLEEQGTAPLYASLPIREV